MKPFHAPPLVRPNDIIDWSLENAVRRHVKRTLKYCGGEVRWAARELGVSEDTVHLWAKKWYQDDETRARGEKVVRTRSQYRLDLGVRAAAGAQ